MNIAVLIATRNRPECLDKLLLSIHDSAECLNQVVIVSSGNPVWKTIDSHKSKLPLHYLHSELRGQSQQKKIGVTLLKPEIDWVIFCDDDMQFKKETIGNAINFIHDIGNSPEVRGIGISVSNNSTNDESLRSLKFLGKIFCLWSSKPGIVMRSGQVTAYSHLEEPCQTEWLNGISMWRLNSALEYTALDLDIPYAAYEDVYFSYSQHMKGQLLYAPSVVIDHQELNTNDSVAITQFYWATLQRAKLVLRFRNLSILQLLWSQIGRNIFFVAREPPSEFRAIYNRIIIVIKANARLISLFLYRK